MVLSISVCLVWTSVLKASGAVSLAPMMLCWSGIEEFSWFSENVRKYFGNGLRKLFYFCYENVFLFFFF